MLSKESRIKTIKTIFSIIFLKKIYAYKKKDTEMLRGTVSGT